MAMRVKSLRPLGRKNASTLQPPAGDMEPNWHLQLRGVGRCPKCGARVELPCRECALAELKRNRRLAAELGKGV